MSNRSICFVTLGALALFSEHSWATELTGNMAAATYSYYDNVVIHDLTITGPPGSTLKIVVYGGSITVGANYVGFGVNGNGADGDPGANGTTTTYPGAGGVADIAYNLTLETWPPISDDVDAPQDWPIEVNRSIDLTGGSGGDGGDGYPAWLEAPCVFHAAQNGAAAAPGRKGGTLTIRATGRIEIIAGVNVSGGKGGDGGSGGDAGLPAPGDVAGTATDGQPGGAAGSIILEHTVSAPSSANCILSIDAVHSTEGNMDANGGSGGWGGNGGFSYPSPTNGGIGRNGGPGGTITVHVHNFSMGGNGDVSVRARADGGLGGAGGQGGDSGKASCYLCDSFSWALQGTQGAIAGHGGDGGDAGDINIACSTSFFMQGTSALEASGGDGLLAGRSGRGGTVHTGACGGDCHKGYAVFSGGASQLPGNGGAGGQINISATTVSLLVNNQYHASLAAEGGDGSDSVPGANPGMHCCHNPELAVYGTGSSGGKGGNGGDGGTISLLYSAITIQGNHFHCCGGNPANGGQGSWGTPFGSGGAGGDGGLPGSLIFNGAEIDPGCIVVDGIQGAMGGPNPPCIDP